MMQILDQQVQDPTARTHNDNLARHRKAFNDMVPVAQSLVNLESVLGKPIDEAEAVVKEIHDQREEYDAVREASIDAVQIPEVLSTEKSASPSQKTFWSARNTNSESMDRSFATPKRSAKKKTKSRSTTWMSLAAKFGCQAPRKRQSGKWKEFQFATTLKDDAGEWRIYYINPKFFTSDASTTPLNSWISGGAIEVELIREGNIGK